VKEDDMHDAKDITTGQRIPWDHWIDFGPAGIGEDCAWQAALRGNGGRVIAQGSKDSIARLAAQALLRLGAVPSDRLAGRLPGHAELELQQRVVHAGRRYRTRPEGTRQNRVGRRGWII
jgi:hypothetical protein